MVLTVYGGLLVAVGALVLTGVISPAGRWTTCSTCST
jgi:hypothetical protein